MDIEYVQGEGKVGHLFSHLNILPTTLHPINLNYLPGTQTPVLRMYMHCEQILSTWLHGHLTFTHLHVSFSIL